jgi:hypothetical protein
LSEQSRIALDCPLCGESIYQPLSWFKKAYSTCPACDMSIPAARFDALLNDLEQAFDQRIDEMLTDDQPQAGGCCGSKKKDSCCGHH